MEPTSPPSGWEEQLENSSCRPTECFLELLLDEPHGAAMLDVPAPPIDTDGYGGQEALLSSPPPSMQDLQQELDAVTHTLEQLRAQLPPALPPPALPHGDTAALLTAFQAAQLRGPMGGCDPQVRPIDGPHPNVCTALRRLGKHMQVLQQQQAAAEVAARMDGQWKAWESQMETLQQRHRLPPT